MEGRDTMTNAARKSLAITVISITMVSHAFAQQPKQSNQDFLQAKFQRFINYETDFNAFARGSNLEWEIPIDLSNVAASASEYLLATQAFLQIYDQLSCEADRGKAWPLITQKLGYYAKQIDTSIKTVNRGLSYTKAPAVATSGTQMKEDLREVKAFFESIRPN
jgi:hypothetical protein